MSAPANLRCSRGPCASRPLSHVTSQIPLALPDLVEMLLPRYSLLPLSLHLCCDLGFTLKCLLGFSRTLEACCRNGMKHLLGSRTSSKFNESRQLLSSHPPTPTPAGQNQFDPGPCIPNKPYPFKRRQVFPSPGSPHPSYPATETRSNPFARG